MRDAGSDKKIGRGLDLCRWRVVPGSAERRDEVVRASRGPNLDLPWVGIQQVSGEGMYFAQVHRHQGQCGREVGEGEAAILAAAGVGNGFFGSGPGEELNEMPIGDEISDRHFVLLRL